MFYAVDQILEFLTGEAFSRDFTPAQADQLLRQLTQGQFDGRYRDYYVSEVRFHLDCLLRENFGLDRPLLDEQLAEIETLDGQERQEKRQWLLLFWQKRLAGGKTVIWLQPLENFKAPDEIALGQFYLEEDAFVRVENRAKECLRPDFALRQFCLQVLPPHHC